METGRDVMRHAFAMGFALVLALPFGIGVCAEPDGGRPWSEPDNAANALHPPPGGKAKFRAQVAAALQRNPNNVTALAHRAYDFERRGDFARALLDYDRALAAAGDDPDLARHVLWSRGWTRYNVGQVEDALDDWRRASALHGGRPFWAPYTLALGYWTSGEQDKALDWFQEAVRANPEWGNPEAAARRTRHWTDPQRLHLEALLTAWLARHQP